MACTDVVKRVSGMAMVLAMAAGVIVGPTLAFGQQSLLQQSGQLEESDQQMPKGEYYDTHTFRAEAGQSIRVSMMSDEFDTYLVLRSPGGRHWTNDDFDSRTDLSRIELIAPESGAYRVMATSYAPGSTGSYRIEAVRLEDPPAAPAPPGPGQRGMLLTRDSWLTHGGESLPKGEYFERLTVQIRQGESIRATMTSAQFDTYLVVRSPSGQQWANDDWDGRTDTSRVDIVADRAGEWTFIATSFAPGAVGRYQLNVEQMGAGGQAGGQAAGAEQAVLFNANGRLAAGNDRLDSGEFVERHTVRLENNQPLRFIMTSNQFDTYIIVRSPSGRQWENDDWEGSTRMSRVDLTTTEAGEWVIVATSYGAGETGQYQIRVENAGQGGAAGDGMRKAGN